MFRMCWWPGMDKMEAGSVVTVFLMHRSTSNRFRMVRYHCQICRCRSHRAHNRICQFHGFSGYGIQKEGPVLGAELLLPCGTGACVRNLRVSDHRIISLLLRGSDMANNNGQQTSSFKPDRKYWAQDHGRRKRGRGR